MLDLFEKVFLLVIDADTQIARLADPAHATSPVRTEAIKRQIREGRHVLLQAQMLARGAIPWTQPRHLRSSQTACWPTLAPANDPRGCSLMPVASLLVTCGTDRMALARFHWDESPALWCDLRQTSAR